MTSLEYKTEFSMWAMAASPLVVTTPIMKCSKNSDEGGDENLNTAVEFETVCQ